MPVFKGIAPREEDNKEIGAAKVLIGFPDAVKTRLGLDKTGALTRISEAYPHQKAMGVDDLRTAIKLSPAGGETAAFFSEALNTLIHHIEATQPQASKTQDRTAPGVSLSANTGMTT